MKIAELEDADQLVTKEFFRAEFAQFELRISDRIIASERATRAAIFGAYGLILGTYALIIAAVYINHFWR